MATNYPNDIDSFIRKIDNVDDIMAAHVNDLQDSIVAIENKLGANNSMESHSVDYKLRNLPNQDSTSLVVNLNADKIDGADLDTDVTLASNSNSKVPSQKAIKSYTDNLLHNKVSFVILESPNGVCQINPENNKTILIPTGLRVLMPNGKQPSGDYKHIDYTLNSNVINSVPFSNSKRGVFGLRNDGTMSVNKVNILTLTRVPNATTYEAYWWYNPDENFYYESNGEKWSVASVILLGSFVTNSSGELSQLTAFVDSNDRILTNRDVIGGLNQTLEYSGVGTFNGATDNIITMSGVVTSLLLERGDVIEITGDCHSDNKKHRTVDEIISNDQIIVNYDHAGNRGDGPLKLYNESNKAITMKRISKWYGSHTGLGREFVNTTFKVALHEPSLISQGFTSQPYGFTQLAIWDGDVYCASGFNIYKQIGGSGSWVDMGLSGAGEPFTGFGICNGTIYFHGGNSIYKFNGMSMPYITVDSQYSGWSFYQHKNDIYYAYQVSLHGAYYVKKQTGGSGAFVDQVTDGAKITAFTSIGDDLYACSINGKIYKQINGSGAFIETTTTPHSFTGIATFEGNLYLCVGGGGVYRQIAGAGVLEPVGVMNKNWVSIKSLGDSLYLADLTDVYRLSFTENTVINNNTSRPIETITTGTFSSNDILKGFCMYKGQARFDSVTSINLKERR